MNPNFPNPNNSGNGTPTNQNSQFQQQPFGAPGFGPVTPNNTQFSNPNSQQFGPPPGSIPPFSAPNATSPNGFGPPPTNMHSFPGPSSNGSTPSNPPSSNGFGASPTNISPFTSPSNFNPTPLNPPSSNGFGLPTSNSPTFPESNPSNNSNPTNYSSPSGFGPPRTNVLPFSAPNGFGPPPVSSNSNSTNYSSPSGFGPPRTNVSPFSAPNGFGPPPVSSNSSSNRPGPPLSSVSPFSTPSGFGPPPISSNAARLNPSPVSGNTQGSFSNHTNMPSSPNLGNSQNSYIPPPQPSFNTAPGPQPTISRNGMAEGTPEWEAAVTSVIDMGFQRNQAVSALRQTNGDVEAAVGYLIDGTLPSSASPSSNEQALFQLKNMLIQNPSSVHTLIDQMDLKPEAKQYLHQHPEEVFIAFEVDLSNIDFSRLAYNPQGNYQMGVNPMPPSGNGQFPSYNANPGMGYQDPSQQDQQNDQAKNIIMSLMSKLRSDQQETVKVLVNEFPNLNPIEVIQSYEACDYDANTTRNLLRTL